jgi:hypothetical protein
MFLESRTGSAWARLRTAASALAHGRPAARHRAALTRMGLAQPRGAAERLLERLVVFALDETGG